MKDARESVDGPAEDRPQVSLPSGKGVRARTVARGAVLLACAAVGLAPAPVMGRREGVRAEPDRPEARARFLMGTRLSIETVGPVSDGAFEAAFREVARLEGILSNWKPESELSLLNDRASKEWFHCSSDLYGAVRAALEWAARTGGAFDPTVEPLVRALGLRAEDGIVPGAGGDAHAGTGMEIRPDGAGGPGGERLPIDWRHVRLRASSRSVRFDATGVALDLGGIGKGIALDAAARVLARHAVRAALLDFGGQILAIGRPQGAEGWVIGIADPSNRDTSVSLIHGMDVSISTSGNGERAVEGPDGPIGHILDPRMQRPAPFDGTVTVAAEDATVADALSTALFVMGPERGFRWAEDRRIAALYLWPGPDGTPGRKGTRAFYRRFPGMARSPGH